MHKRWSVLRRPPSLTSAPRIADATNTLLPRHTLRLHSQLSRSPLLLLPPLPTATARALTPSPHHHHHHLLPSPTNLTPNYPDHHHARHGLLNTPLHARHRALIITRRVPPGLARRRRRAVPRARDRAPVLPLRLARRARAQLPLQVAAPPLDVVS